MNDTTRTSPHHAPFPPYSRRTWPLALLGTVAVLSLLLQPLPVELLAKSPELAALPPLAQRAVLLANPWFLVLMAAALGAGVAHRVGLRSVLAGTAPAAGWTGVAARAASAGIALGMVLAAADAAITPLLGSAWQALVAATPGGAAATVMGVLYGGVAEEVMLRWGAMSLIAWATTSLLGSQARTVSMALAIGVAAILFAAGHLPALAVQLDLTPAIVTRTMVLNGVAGLLYGWLFWHRHLEAAMVAHACTHLGLAAWRLLQQ